MPVLVNLVDTRSLVLTLNASMFATFSEKLWSSTSLWSAEYQEISSLYKLANILLSLEDFNNPDISKRQIIVAFMEEVV